MKIISADLELLHTNRQTDSQTDKGRNMMMFLGAFLKLSVKNIHRKMRQILIVSRFKRQTLI
jgi:hypothetical protein